MASYVTAPVSHPVQDHAPTARATSGRRGRSAPAKGCARTAAEEVCLPDRPARPNQRREKDARDSARPSLQIRSLALDHWFAVTEMRAPSWCDRTYWSKTNPQAVSPYLFTVLLAAANPDGGAAE